MAVALQGRFSCLKTETHGNHGVNPPNKEIQDEIQAWLESLPLKNVSDNISYQLQVEARRIPIDGDFIGVKAFRIPSFNKSCVETRVRPKGNDYQWQCFLSFPNQRDMCNTLLDIVRPSAVNRYGDEIEQYFEEIDKIEDTKVRKERITEAKLVEKYIGVLEFNGTIKKLCHSIQKMRDEDNLITKDDLRFVVSKYLDYNIPAECWVGFIQHLMIQGIVEPIADNHDEIFKTTMLLDEYSNEVRNEKQAKERQQIDREIGKMMNEKIGIQEQRKRTWRQLTEYRTKLRAIERGLKAKKARLLELDSD